MKKNAMLKIAAVLLVAVLLTTCFISSTFAKYVTEGVSGSSDTATVADWNLSITNVADAKLFKPTFTTTDGKILANINGSDQVLAPGTKNADSEFGVTISGKPEVAFAIYAYVDVALENWKLEDNSEYCPVVFTVNDVAQTAEVITDVAAYEVTVEKAIAAAILGVQVSALKTTTKNIGGEDKTVYYAEYEANTDLTNAKAIEANVEWEWKFEGLTGQTDKKDTELGNAGTKATAEVDYTVFAEQIASFSA